MAGLYSPKIKEDLIPYLYKISRHLGQPMTKTVNHFLEQAITQFKETGIFDEIEAEQRAVEALTEHIRKLLNARKTKTAEVIELLRKVA